MMRFPPWESQKKPTPFRPNARNHPQAKRVCHDDATCGQKLQISHASLGSWLDGPRVQHPSLESINVLKSRTAKPAHPSPGIGTQEAYGLAFKALQGYSRRNIICLDPSKACLYSRKKLPFMVFDQLDKELFRSVLTGNVYLIWSRKLSPYCKGITFRQGHHGHPRIAIRLAESLLNQAGRKEIIAILIHQMIHAYFLQCCGFRNKALQASGSGYDLEHGFEFQALFRSIKQVCPPVASRYSWDLNAHDGMLPGGRSVERYPVIGASNCAGCDRSCKPNIEIEQWRLDALAVTNSLVDLRALESQKESSKKVESSPLPGPQQPDFYFIEGTEISCPLPRAEYDEIMERFIEIHFQSKVFPLHRNAVSQHIEELAKSPVFTNNRILTLPTTTTLPSLILLCQFLQRDSTELVLAESSFPIIDPHSRIPTDQAKDFISAYYLALDIALPAFAIDSQSQLSNRSTLDDPIAVLDAIYHPESINQSPDSHLRNWAKSWLSARIPESNTLYGSLYSTNIDILRGCPRYKGECQKLCEKSTLLEKDIDFVQARIKEAADLKNLKLPTIEQGLPASYQYNFGQDPYPRPNALQLLHGWPNGFQQPIQAEQTHSPLVPQFWGQNPNNPQEVG